MAGFSYAQAAKGRAPVPATALPSKQEQDKDQPAVDASAPSESKPSADSLPQGEIDRVEPEDTTKTDDNAASSKAPTVESQSTSAESDPAPSALAESAATLIKDDEATANAADSESTTWEKVSQGSQPAEKDTVKSSVASDDSKASDSWEHVQAPQPTLKEAPLPTVNPWLKRAQDAQAKVKTSRPTANSLPASPSSSLAGDARKKNRQPLVETNGINTAEKSSKSDEAAVRRYKPSSETRFSSRIPPPTTDAMSWPKPEFAKLDEKDAKPKSASQERNEVDEGDKDKATGTKKPKTHWEPIPFTPTAVFATPLPTSRRGGRGGARGGRETGSGRGAATTNANDRASDRDGRTPSSEAPVERMSKSETTTRPNQGPRQKRMSNAAQNKPRDFKKTDEAVLGEDTRVNGTDAPAGDLSANGQNSVPVSNADFTAGSNASFGQVPNGFDAAEIPQLQDGRIPRTFRENRGEFVGQGRDFGRDGNGMPREGGGRGGRGGRGRGRGGHNLPYYGSHASSSSAFVPNNGSFNGPMAHGTNERQASYFGTGRGDGRHYRSGSRSQGGGPASSNRFFQNGPQFPMQMHDMSNGYSYAPAMQQAFYHPAMEQAPILGILSEQIRYYFSLENLLRDTYLRSRMDDQGFIPLEFMLPWKRMTMITTDANLVRYACQNIAEIELRLDVNGIDYIRPAVDWQHWVMKREDRLPDARNAGPNLQPTATPFAHQFAQPHMFPGQLPPMLYPQQGPPHRHGPGHAVNGSPPRLNKAAAQAHMNGHAEGSPTHTPLSAEVPEFQPDPSLSSSNILTSNSQDTFSDAQMQHLSIVTQASGSSDKNLANGINVHLAPSSEHAAPESASGPIVASTDAE